MKNKFLSMLLVIAIVMGVFTGICLVTNAEKGESPNLLDMYSYNPNFDDGIKPWRTSGGEIDVCDEDSSDGDGFCAKVTKRTQEFSVLRLIPDRYHCVDREPFVVIEVGFAVDGNLKNSAALLESVLGDFFKCVDVCKACIFEHGFNVGKVLANKLLCTVRYRKLNVFEKLDITALEPATNGIDYQLIIVIVASVIAVVGAAAALILISRAKTKRFQNSIKKHSAR
jgi:hypothetical protein